MDIYIFLISGEYSPMWRLLEYVTYIYYMQNDKIGRDLRRWSVTVWHGGIFIIFCKNVLTPTISINTYDVTLFCNNRKLPFAFVDVCTLLNHIKTVLFSFTLLID